MWNKTSIYLPSAGDGYTTCSDTQESLVLFSGKHDSLSVADFHFALLENDFMYKQTALQHMTLAGCG